jgi:hypothetical protein
VSRRSVKRRAASADRLREAIMRGTRIGHDSLAQSPQDVAAWGYGVEHVPELRIVNDSVFAIAEEGLFLLWEGSGENGPLHRIVWTDVDDVRSQEAVDGRLDLFFRLSVGSMAAFGVVEVFGGLPKDEVATYVHARVSELSILMDGDVPLVHRMACQIAEGFVEERSGTGPTEERGAWHRELGRWSSHDHVRIHINLDSAIGDRRGSWNDHGRWPNISSKSHGKHRVRGNLAGVHVRC